MTAKTTRDPYYYKGTTLFERYFKREGVTKWKGRYTLANKTRPTTEFWREDKAEAYRDVVTAQQAVERQSYRNPNGGRMLFREFVETVYLPKLEKAPGNTRRTRHSHLGRLDGQPRRNGKAAQQAAEISLINTFGHLKLLDIGPDEIEAWQDRLLRDGYEVSTIEAKRSLLRVIMEMALKKNWGLAGNPVDATPEVPDVQHKDTDRTVSVAEWEKIREQFTGETVRLLLSVQLWAGLRHQQVSALRPADLVEPVDGKAPLLWVRQANNGVGAGYTGDGRRFEMASASKGRKWYYVHLARWIYDELVEYIAEHEIADEALIFDYERARAEYYNFSSRRKTPSGEPDPEPYVKAGTQQKGAHGKYTTYNLGCRCDHCSWDSSERRRTARRAEGKSIQSPWTEPGWAASRRTAVDPIPSGWVSQQIWNPALIAAGIDRDLTPHGVRHAMINWSLQGGAGLLAVQQAAAHSRLTTTQHYITDIALRHPDPERLAAQERWYDAERGVAPVTTPTPDPTASLSPIDQGVQAEFTLMDDEEKTMFLLERARQRKAAAASAERHLKAVE